MLRFIFECLLWPLRGFNLLALLIHGFGHALALWLVTGKRGFLHAETILEHCRLADLANSLLPYQPLPQFSKQPPQIAVTDLSATQSRWVAVSGMGMNGLSVLLVFGVSQTPALFEQLALVYFVVASVLAAASWPDLLGLLTGRIAYLACGPAFAVRYALSSEEKASPQLVSERLRALVEILAREASTRGGQSGGFSILVKKLDALSIIFDKAVKGKREDIVKVVCQKMTALLTKARREGYSKAGDFEAVLLHLRYATGGATHWHNAQPHWYEHYSQMAHHRVVNQGFEIVNGEVFNMIAHNGDMDGVHLQVSINGQLIRHYFSQIEARALFMRAMPSTTSQGNSDSRSVAEWVDFVYTQGLVYKSLRYAYFTAGLDYNQDICNNHFNLTPLQLWADSIELLIAQTNPAQVLSSNAEKLADLNPELKQKIVAELQQQAKAVIDPSRLNAFIAVFENAFYRHDLHYVMCLASRDLVGEFALMVCTTLEPRLAVFSLTQAFSLGHNRTRGEIFGSAEPQGVTSALQFGNPDDDSLQIYLADGQFATIEYYPNPEQDPVRIYDRVQANDVLNQVPSPAANTLLVGNRHSERCDWFIVNDNPKIDRYTRNRPASKEEVKRDIQDIPYVLRRIRNSFTVNGENAATMQHFCQALFARLLDPQRDPRQYDLVLFGVDFNQDLGKEFSIALHSIFPSLRVHCENSGNVLKQMKRNRREGIGRYSQQTLFLGISNSAQTQSTLAAIRKSYELAGAERCFILTQSFLNSMTQALGQGFHPDDPLLPNTFVNLSHWASDNTCGRRRSEAATLIPVATHAVLTEILLHLTQHATDLRQAMRQRGEFEVLKSFEFRDDLSSIDLQAFRDFQSVIYEVEIPNRVGCNVQGQPIASPDAEALQHEAAARAENSIEFIRAYAIFAAYIVIATLFGVPVFAVLATPFAGIPGIGMLSHILDAALFLSALWLIHCGIRYWQGRPVLERIGARAELYIDRRYIARMIERYNATLFSNAPAFITPFFYWADTVQDALHRYGIRAHRGVVTIHRTPDERLGVEEANNAAEENMVLAQIGGIRFNRGQPQSRDKVRAGSHYMNRNDNDRKARPNQLVLSDSLVALRQQYDHKLSSETLRLINRRLIDLSDGLIVEFILGEARKALIDRAVWDVIRWMPGSMLLYQALLATGIDLMNITGEADTANQAQIQSTKHPVSPIDIHLQTMNPRDSVGAEFAEVHQGLGLISLGNDEINIAVNRVVPGQSPAVSEIKLHPGAGKDRGTLVDIPKFRQAGKFVGVLKMMEGEEYFVIDNQQQCYQLCLPTAYLDEPQRQFLHRHLKVNLDRSLANVA